MAWMPHGLTQASEPFGAGSLVSILICIDQLALLNNATLSVGFFISHHQMLRLEIFTLY